MSKLAFPVGKGLGKDKMRKVFHMKDHEFVYNFSDIIKQERVEYQVEKIPNFFFENNATDSNKGGNILDQLGIDLEEEASGSGN